MSLSIYISPKGNDGYPGTSLKPFASLRRAKEEIGSLIAAFPEGGSEDINVYLDEGVHRLNQTHILDRQLSGNSDFRINWIGSEEGRTIITSGYPLDGWKKLEEDPQELPQEVRRRVWYTDLPESSRIKNIYGPEGPVPRARGKAVSPKPLDLHGDLIPNTIYGPDSPLSNEQKQVPFSHDCFAFEEGSITDAGDLHEAECLIIPRNQWTMNILPVQSLDRDRNLLYLKESCTYPIGVPHCAPDGSIWLENSLSVMTPGTWVYHSHINRLFYCPSGEKPEDNLEAATLTELIRVEECENVHFSHITFTGTNRFSFHGLTGKGIQHDWEMHDAPSCMLRFRHVRNSSVKECRFIDGGSGGVRFDLASSENSVIDNEFSRLGGCGILLCGYGLSRKSLNRNNTVRGNHLHHLGQSYWHSPGIFIWQSGENHISDNSLHDLPYTGIVCSGRTIYDREGKGECSGTIDWDDVEVQCGKGYVHNDWYYGGITSWQMREPLMHSRDNLIEYNWILDVMQVMGDGNGIYVSGAGGGNVVRYNAVGPCESPHMAEGIRCDDDQHQTIVHGNLIFRQGGMGTGITIKGVNRVTNNILALPSVEKTERGMLSLETGPLNGAVIRNNIIYTGTPGQKFVHEMRIHGEGRKARLQDTESDKNIFYCVSSPDLGVRWVSWQQGFGNDYGSLGCDPGFVDPENGDFKLKSDSQALASGFKPLPLERMLAVPKNSSKEGESYFD